MSRAKWIRLFSGLSAALSVLILGYMVIRPIHLRYGATDDELRRPMSGDLAGRRWTRAVTVAAPPEKIWPWLIQWGQGRGGWYSYDWLENLLGMDIHTADRILPEYQNTAVGDPICMAANACISFVSVVEPNRWFGWQSKDDTGKPVWNFVFGLFPVDEMNTRLIIRESFDPNAMPKILTFAIEIPDVVMMLKALHTVKQRAEGIPASIYTTLFEVTAWLFALMIGIIAGVQFIRQDEWRVPLAIGVVSILVLLVLTFLFLPLWQRGILDLGLFSALLWQIRSRTKRFKSTG